MPNPPRPSSRRATQDFLRRLREVYKLVAAADLGDVWLRADSDVLIVGHGVSRSSRRGRPVPLSNGMFLNVQMTLRVQATPNGGPPRLQTLRTAYRYQAGHDLDDPKPLFVYEYNRNAPAQFPRCHLHVHATPHHDTPPKPFSRLHLPTRRITLEQIVWHLIHDHGVQPRRPDWHDILWRHETNFRDIQRTQPWPYALPFDPPRID